MPVYRPSPNELDRLIREETEKRKRMRLIQVREQSKINAARLRNAYKGEMKRQVNGLVRRYRIEALDEKENEIKTLVDKYESSLRHVGDGHHTAKEWRDPHWDRLIAEEAASVLSQERYRLALDQLRESQAADEFAASEANRHRQSALAVEKLRSKYVASLPKPQPPPYESALERKRGRAVAVCDRKAMSTHFHIVPYNYAVEGVDPRSDAAMGPDARAKAAVEEEKMAALRQRAVTGLEENVIKAEMRGKDAIRREIIRQDYDTMLRDLEGLSRGDLARRQRDFQRLPQRLFAVPHRMGYESRVDERNRERGFESAFAGLLNNHHSDRGDGDGDDDDDDDDAGVPRPAIRPSSPTRVRRSRRRHPEKSDRSEEQRDSTSGGKTVSDSRLPTTFDVSRSLFDEEKSVEPREEHGDRDSTLDSASTTGNSGNEQGPNVLTKEQKLQSLYAKIRSQRDKWLGYEEPVRDRPASPKVPSAVHADGPTSASRSLPHFSDTSAPHMFQPSETDRVTSPTITDDQSEMSLVSEEREPGRRAPMTNLDEVRRIRSLAYSQARDHDVRLRPDDGESEEEDDGESTARSQSQRDQLDEELRELDRKIEELKQRGRQMTAGSRYLDILAENERPKRDAEIQSSDHSSSQFLPSQKSNSDSYSVTSQLSADATSKTGGFGESGVRTVYSPPERDTPQERTDAGIDLLRNYQRKALMKLETMSVGESSTKEESESSYETSISRQATQDLERQVARLREQLDRENRREELIRHYINVRAARGQLERIGVSYTNASNSLDVNSASGMNKGPTEAIQSFSPTTLSPMTKTTETSATTTSDFSKSFPDTSQRRMMTRDLPHSPLTSDKASYGSRGVLTDLDRSSLGVKPLPIDNSEVVTADDLPIQQILRSASESINVATSGDNGSSGRPLAFLTNLTSDETPGRVVIEPGELSFDTLRSSDVSQLDDRPVDDRAANYEYRSADSSPTPVASPETAVFMGRGDEEEEEEFVTSSFPLPLRFRGRPPPVQYPISGPIIASHELSRISEVETPASSAVSGSQVESRVMSGDKDDGGRLDFDDIVAPTEEDRRAALIRNFFSNNASKLEGLRGNEEERKDDLMSSLRSSLTQHTAALSDLNSSDPVEEMDEDEFCALPALETRHSFADTQEFIEDAAVSGFSFDRLSSNDPGDHLPTDGNDKELTLQCLATREVTQVPNSESHGDDGTHLTQFSASTFSQSPARALDDETGEACEPAVEDRLTVNQSNFVPGESGMNFSHFGSSQFEKLEETSLTQYSAFGDSAVRSSVDENQTKPRKDEVKGGDVRFTTTHSAQGDMNRPASSSSSSRSEPGDPLPDATHRDPSLHTTSRSDGLSQHTATHSNDSSKTTSEHNIAGGNVSRGSSQSAHAMDSVLCSHSSVLDGLSQQDASNTDHISTVDGLSQGHFARLDSTPASPGLSQHKDVDNNSSAGSSQRQATLVEITPGVDELSQKRLSSISAAPRGISQQPTTGTTGSLVGDDLSQRAVTHTSSSSYPRTTSLTQLPLSDTSSSKNGEITQHTVSTLSSLYHRPLSQNPISCLSSDVQSKSDTTSLRSLNRDEATNKVSEKVQNGREENHPLTQALRSNRASDESSDIQRFDYNANSNLDRPISLTQYPASISSKESHQRLHQDGVETGDLNQHNAMDPQNDTLQVLDTTMPSYEIADSRKSNSVTKNGSEFQDLPIASDQPLSSTSEGSSLTSIDRLIAESQKLRKLNEHSLRSFEMTSMSGILGEPDLSLVSGSNTSGANLSQFEVKTVSEEEKNAHGSVNTSDHGSLASFKRHEQSCNSESPLSHLSTDLNNGLSLQEAFEAHRSRLRSHNHPASSRENGKKTSNDVLAATSSSARSTPPMTEESRRQPTSNGRYTRPALKNGAPREGEVNGVASNKQPVAKSQQPVRPDPVIERRLQDAREATAASNRPSAAETKSAGNIDEMRTTLEAWKKARLTRNRGSNSHSSSNSSSDDLRSQSNRPEASACDDPIVRNRRLWNQLEEVQTRARLEEFEKDKVKYRAKGREYSDKLRAQLRSKQSSKSSNASTSSESRDTKSTNGSSRPKA